MANGVTSQWEDLQIKHGNYEEREKVETLAENYQKNLDKSHQKEQQEEKRDSLDDEFDEHFFQQFKDQRLKEFQEKRDKYKFGQVYEIGREDFIKEVTEASKDQFVVLSLYADSIQESLLFNSRLDELAKENGQIKFVKMVATKCIENFPDNQCPCLIIYKDGKSVSNLPMVHKYLRKITTAAVEYLLKEQGVLKKDVEQDEDYEEIQQQLKNPYKNNRTEVDDEVKDREYMDI